MTNRQGFIIHNEELTEAKVEEIAEGLRQEAYHPLFNNCLTKSLRFAKKCKRLDIEAGVVLTLSKGQALSFAR